MILPSGDQSLMTFLFVRGVTRRLSLEQSRAFFSLTTRLDVNYVCNGYRDTLPLILRRTTSAALPRFNNYTSPSRLIVHLWRALL